MRIHVLSDLHLEFAKMSRTYVQPDCDVVILSGDISPGVPGVIWAKETFTVPVIYVPGNHEYYIKRTMAEQVAAMRKHAEGSNVIILDDETVDIDGVRFIGTTLWTDFDLYGQNFFHQVVAQRSMNDYAYIFVGPDRHLTTDDSLQFHKNARQFITDELVKEFDGKKVVVSHHAPSTLSVAPKWMNHPLTPAYASRLENLILDYGPVLWTHGHVHDTFNYMIGDTRVVANPRGYFQNNRTENGLFDEAFVVEI